jgi:two-component sensor histidine kinase
MKRLSLTTLFLLSVFSIFSQQTKIDSLKNELLIENIDTKKLEILTSLNKLLFDIGNPEESLPFYEQMRDLAISQNKKKTEIQSYKYLSEYYMKKMDSINAKKIALKSIQFSKDNQLHEQVIQSLNQLARVFHNFQDYEKAIKLYREGIYYYNKHPEGKIICILYSNLGIALGLVGKEEEQIKAFIKGSEYAEKIKDYQSKFMFLNNLGWAYMSQEQYAKAEKYLLIGLNDSLNIKDRVDLIGFHHTSGLNYSRWGKYPEALKHNKIALDYYKKIGDKRFEFDVLNNTAVVYRKMNQPKKVIEISKKTLKIAQELNHKLAIFVANHTAATAYLDLNQFNEAEKIFLEIAKDSINPNLIDTQTLGGVFNNLSKVYEGKKDFKKSLYYLKRFKTINDSTLIKQRDSKVSEIETKYQTEKKEKENLQLKSENTEQALSLVEENKQKWLFGGGLLGVAILSLVFWRKYKTEEKAKKVISLQKDEIVEQKEVIETLQKDLHHRVKNNLAIINRFIDVVKDEFNNEAFDTKLIELQNRITSINEVHEQLYNNEDATKLGVKKYIEKLKLNIEKTYSNKNITVEQYINETVDMKADKSFPIGLIVNEFLTNSFKYAFPDNTKGKILIDINESEDHYNLKLTDDGKGFPQGFDGSSSKTFGLRIMKLLTQQIDGTFDIDGSNGVNLTIQFPK